MQMNKNIFYVLRYPVVCTRQASTSIANIKNQINNKIISNFKFPERLKGTIFERSNFKFPERLKGTIFERWAVYWQNLLRDYRDVAKDTLTSSRKEPGKTMVIFSVFGLATFCFKNNPDEKSYRDAVVSYASDMIFVGPTTRNPKSIDYLKFIETNYNHGTLHRTSFGVFSIIWQDRYNNYVGLYKAQCPYLELPFYKFHEKIVDIGFLNTWWALEREMKDYDINPEEWLE